MEKTKRKLKGKFLVITRSIPPASTGSSTIMANLLKQFDNQEMIAVGSYFWGQPTFKWHKNYPRIIYAMLQLPWHWRGEHYFCILQWPIMFMISFITLLFSRCNKILVVYPDYLFLFAGFLISRLSGKPLYAYFHNMFAENSLNSRFRAWLQRKVFFHAKHLFVISEGMRNYYKEKYPELKCTPITHIIENIKEGQNASATNTINGPIKLAISGNINGSCLEAATRVVELVKRNHDYTLNIFSGMDPKLFKKIGFFADNINIKAISRDFILNKISECDIVIHPHGFSGSFPLHEYLTIFPTKTIEYLICGKPIIAHMPKNCFITEFYRKNRCALIIDDPSIEAIDLGIKKLCSDDLLRCQLVKNALLTAEQFKAEVVVNNFIDIVNQ